MNEDVLKETIADILVDMLGEGKKKKIVVRGGKRKRVTTDTSKGKKIVNGKSVTMGAAERVKRKRSAHKAAIKKKPKQNRINRKRAKSMRRRNTMGM